MNAEMIRLFEHIKLLQKGVELYEKDASASRVDVLLPNGLNGKNVRLGLLGAMSAGKTTLIKRLIGDSAGRISSGPETACLVVHSFSKSERLTFNFRDEVRFDSEEEGREFSDFLKNYKLEEFYNKNDVKTWELKSGVEQDGHCREYAQEEILSFFQQVNKFGVQVFKKIIWTHRQRRNNYNLTDLIDIYDFPGFGGRMEHDKAIAETLGKEALDVLIYLIDSSRGIPSQDELEYLGNVEEYLKANPQTSFYWAYEKPLPDSNAIDIDALRSQIAEAVSKGNLGIDSLAQRLLDLTGPDNGENDELHSKIMVDVLKPYYVRQGKNYRDESYRARNHECENEVINNEVFSDGFLQEDGWPLVHRLLDRLRDTENEKRTSGPGLDKSAARKIVLECLLGDKAGNKFAKVYRDGKFAKLSLMLKGAFRKKTVRNANVTVGDAQLSRSEADDRTLAIEAVVQRIDNAIDVFLSSIYNLDGNMSLTKMGGSFQREVYKAAPIIRMLVYDVQMFWMLQNPKGVAGFIKAPILGRLLDNIDSEVKAIEEFEID